MEARAAKVVRGCLWTAAAMQCQSQRDNNKTKRGKKGKGNKCHNKGEIGSSPLNEIKGGVVTLDKVWPSKTSKEVIPDTSSYEYSISLLSQALRCSDVEERIKEFICTFKISTSKSKHGEQFI